MTSRTAEAPRVVPEARPVVLEVSPDAVFGTFHDAAPGLEATTAVLLVPPWGWDEVTSYRSRRAWAQRLAADGHPTLRIDLPAAGDSAGDPRDPGRVDAWRAAIHGSAAWLAARDDVTRVATIGLGLGGLLTAAGIAGGAPIDDLVLWAAPDGGRAWFREQRAFAALQTSRVDPGGKPVEPGVPDDWLEVGGFTLSDETIASLQALELGRLLAGCIGRVLLLDRDGMPYGRRLVDALVEGGAEVTEESGAGWSRMVFHPEQYHAPTGAFDAVEAWLRRAAPGSGSSRPAVPPPPTADVLELPHDGVDIRETPIRIREPFGELFGIQAEPIDRRGGDLCAVFLNAGAVRRIGPNRLWVETARRWAARGVPSIRMDLEGIGDADGDPGRYADVGNFYTPEFGAQVSSIVDDLAGRGFGPRFVLVGLCAGAYWAFHTAATDPRIVESVILNPRAMIWDSGLLARREAKKAGQVLEAGAWRRLVRGEIELSRIVDVSRAVAGSAASAARRAPTRLVTRRRTPEAVALVESRLDILRDRETRLVLAFSGDEPVRDELEADGILGQLDRWPNVALIELPASDHTLRPIPAQQAATVLLDAELDRLLGSASA